MLATQWVFSYVNHYIQPKEVKCQTLNGSHPATMNFNVMSINITQLSIEQRLHLNSIAISVFKTKLIVSAAGFWLVNSYMYVLCMILTRANQVNIVTYGDNFKFWFKFLLLMYTVCTLGTGKHQAMPENIYIHILGCDKLIIMYFN